jgi:hypothetical protein
MSRCVDSIKANYLRDRLNTERPELQPDPPMSNDGTASLPPMHSDANLVFREPFTVKLHLGNGRVFEKLIDWQLPYVLNNEVSLLAGESFGVRFIVRNGEIASVSYQKDGEADLYLSFEARINNDGRSAMKLTLMSNVTKILYMDGVMGLPEDSLMYKTSILPVRPGAMNSETWPHPIVLLVLKNIRFTEKPPVQASESISGSADGVPKPSM